MFSSSTGQKKGTNEAIARCGFLSQLQSGSMKSYQRGRGIRPSERTTPLMSSSVGVTNSSFISNEPETSEVRPATEKYFWQLVAKTPP